MYFLLDRYVLNSQCSTLMYQLETVSHVSGHTLLVI